jgi:hypothetical protein
LYPTDLYGYYQVLYGRLIELPFRTVAYVTVGTVGGVEIGHVVLTDTVVTALRRLSRRQGPEPGGSRARTTSPPPLRGSGCVGGSSSYTEVASL